MIPFAIMLLTIAIGPLVAEHWWEKNTNKLIISFILGVPTRASVAERLFAFYHSAVLFVCRNRRNTPFWRHQGKTNH